jgi:methylmalonyl-CoA epimerase
MPERLEEVHHIGIAVRDLVDAKKIYCDILGLEYTGEMSLPERGVRVAFLETGNTKIELLEGIGENSPVSKFVERHGPGVQHLCFEVGDIRRVMRELADAGVRLIDSEPRMGAEGKLVAFLHPKSASGVLIELQEK